MPLEWSKPKEVGHMGLVYLSKCQQFMIVQAKTREYKLFYVGPPYETVGKYLSLNAAKSEAATKKALHG